MLLFWISTITNEHDLPEQFLYSIALFQIWWKHPSGIKLQEYLSNGSKLLGDSQNIKPEENLFGFDLNSPVFLQTKQM